MWVVANNTPYTADRTWIQDKYANKLWLVVVKATFNIQPNGSCLLSSEQVPVFPIAQPYGEFGESSLIYESDLLGVKPCTDVLVNGSAWAPRGKPTDMVDVKVSIGPITKQLRVFGDRFWKRGVLREATMTSPQPFELEPIIYEKSYGGWDRTSPERADHRLESRNPVGTGFATQAENCIGKRLPNIEYPDQLIVSWRDRPAPAALNAIDCSWSPRRELAGTYDEKWRQTRFPLWAEDFDPHYNNCAPVDQQVQGFLKGGEAIELINLSANGRVAFQLPRIILRFRTRFGIKRVEHQSQLCTVIIEPSVPRVIMVWQTSLVCNGQMDELDETAVRQASYLAQ